MLEKYMITITMWIVSFVVWLFISPIIHELSHLLTAYLFDLRIKGFRLITIPGGGRGYVDVVIPRSIKNYRFKKSMMHLSGLLSHLITIILSGSLLALTDNPYFKIILITGLIINIYLLVLNALAEESDGRKLWDNIH